MDVIGMQVVSDSHYFPRGSAQSSLSHRQVTHIATRNQGHTRVKFLCLLSGTLVYREMCDRSSNHYELKYKIDKSDGVSFSEFYLIYFDFFILSVSGHPHTTHDTQKRTGWSTRAI